MSYKYEPLPDGHIRLIRLLSNSRRRNLCFELVQAKLFDCASSDCHICQHSTRPPFTAISYTWDGQRPSEPCKINRKTSRITPNVTSIFRHVETARSRRRSDSPLIKNEYYWIDALCINQADLAERGRQVAHMKHIYSSSNCLVLWLGEHKRFTAAALGPGKRKGGHVCRFGTGYGICEHPTCVYADHKHKERESANRGLAELMCRPYWRRSWVLQEATTPDPDGGAYVCCGPYFAARRDFLDECMSGPPMMATAKDILIFFFLSLLRDLIGIRSGNTCGYGMRFADLLSFLPYLENMECSDPNDKLYATLPLTPDSPIIIPDYTRKPIDTYRLFAVTTILKKRNLDILAYAGFGHCTGPSWVPAWSNNTPEPRLTRAPFRHGVSNEPVRGDADVWDEGMRKHGELPVMGLKLFELPHGELDMRAQTDYRVHSRDYLLDYLADLPDFDEHHPWTLPRFERTPLEDMEKDWESRVAVYLVLGAHEPLVLESRRPPPHWDVDLNSQPRSAVFHRLIGGCNFKGCSFGDIRIPGKRGVTKPYLLISRLTEHLQNSRWEGWSTTGAEAFICGLASKLCTPDCLPDEPRHAVEQAFRASGFERLVLR